MVYKAPRSKKIKKEKNGAYRQEHTLQKRENQRRALNQ